MQIRFLFLFIFISQYGFSQLIQPPFHGLFQDSGPPSAPAPVGGNAICDGTTQTKVVTFTSATGKIWMDRNLGASRAATSSTDYEAYGCLYQWGRGNDGHASIVWTSSIAGTPVNSITSTLSDTDTPENALFIRVGGTPYDWRIDNNNLRWQNGTQVNNPCPDNFRVPTETELNAELTQYNITSMITAYSNSDFKFAFAGTRLRSDGALGSAANGSYIWLSTISLSNARFRNINSGSVVSSFERRAAGNSVRCIKN